MDAKKINSAQLAAQQTAINAKQSLGCMWLIAPVAVFVGWLFGLCSWLSIARHTFGTSDMLADPLGPLITFFLPGALAFAFTVSVSQSPLISFLPPVRRWRWIWVTFVGGVGYWLVAWLFLTPWRDNAIVGFAPLLGSVEGTDFPESLVVARAVIVGIATGIGGGVVLAVPQWLILRHHVRRAWWWLLATFVGGAVFLACFLGYIADVIQKGGWN